MHQRLHPVRFVGVVVVLASAPGLAMAYIDPGNGAYMVQVIFTLVGAGAFYIRHPIRSLRAVARWLSDRSTRNKSPVEADAEGSGTP